MYSGREPPPARARSTHEGTTSEGARTAVGCKADLVSTTSPPAPPLAPPLPGALSVCAVPHRNTSNREWAQTMKGGKGEGSSTQNAPRGACAVRRFFWTKLERKEHKQAQNKATSEVLHWWPPSAEVTECSHGGQHRPAVEATAVFCEHGWWSWHVMEVLKKTPVEVRSWRFG